MAKVKSLINKAKKELNNDKEERVLGMIKESLSNIASMKKTLRKAETAHKKLLESDIDDLELEGFEY